ncbi:MAG: D-alanyl-D-alanine carboxypeptidase family protein [Candidatus Binatia bacterium]
MDHDGERMKSVEPGKSMRPGPWARPSRGWKGAAILTIAALLAAPAAADPPPEPVSGADFQAQRAFVGDPLLGMGPGEAGNLYTLDADDPAHMASTTKSFTLLLAVEAVEAGFVSLNDAVTISTKAATIDNNHGGSGQSTHTKAGFSAGEQVLFQDLLYAMMLPSGGDAAIAIAQHVAVSIYPVFVQSSDAAQEGAFVALMNARAEELGLTETYFFNPYGGDHAHADDNTAGEDVAHQASTREMAEWFSFAMQYPLFRQVAGFQGTYSFNTLGGTSYGFSKSFSYPGTQGGKGGSGGGCGTCSVSESRRIGRDLVVAYTQGQGGDGVVLLDYGFASLFHPSLQAESPKWTGGWVDHDLACVNDQYAASVVVRPEGTLDMLLWGLDLEQHVIDHVNAPETQETPSGDLLPGDPGGGDGGRPSGLQSSSNDDERPDELSDPNRQPPPPGPDSYGSKSEPPIASRARIDYAGEGNLVVIAETDLGIYLHSFGITKDETVVLRDSGFVGEGSDARVFALYRSLIVSAHRRPTGVVEIQSWHLDPATGLLGNPLDAEPVTKLAAGELELSGWRGFAANYRILVAGQDGATLGRRLASFNVHRQTGAIDFRDDWSSSNTTAERLALARVPQYDDARDIHALAFRTGDLRLGVTAFELLDDGTIVWRGGATTLPELTANATLEIAAYEAGGVMIAVQSDTNAALQGFQAWALDPSATGSGITPNRIALETASQDGLVGLCRAPSSAVEGDFLLAHGVPGVDALRLQVWRSGPRGE